MAEIKIKVTIAGFDEHFSVDEWFNLAGLTNREIYDKMLNFVVDEKDQPVTVDEARKLFKTVKKSEWKEYVDAFYQAVSDAFVSPTNGDS